MWMAAASQLLGGSGGGGGSSSSSADASADVSSIFAGQDGSGWSVNFGEQGISPWAIVAGVGVVAVAVILWRKQGKGA